MKCYLGITAFLLPCILLATTESVVVNRVVDGDTVVVTNELNQNIKLRIVGIDTPEIVATNRPVECFGLEASNYAKELLPIGSVVTLEHSDELDKYDRLLSYIRLADESDFGKKMITDGYAYAYRSYDHQRKAAYIATEARSRLNKNGLWADNACRDTQQSVQQTQATWKYYIQIINQISKIVDSFMKLFS